MPGETSAPRQGEATAHLHDLEVLNTIHRIADSSGLSLHERLSAIVKVIAFHLRVNACSVYLEEPVGSGQVTLYATHGLNAQAVGRVVLASGEGVTGWVAREGTPLPVEDTAGDPRFKIVQGIGEEGFRSILAAPIRLDQRLIGVINVQTREVRAYPSREVRLLETIGMHLGGIIRSSQLYEDARKQVRQMRIINGIGQAIVSTLHVDPLLEMVMEKSREITNTRGGELRLWNEDTQQISVRVSTGESLPAETHRPLYLGEGIPGMAALKQQAYLVNRHAGEAMETLLPVGVRDNYLCVPVVYQGRSIGTIAVFDKAGPTGEVRRLDGDDQALLQALANQVAVAIRNAQVCDDLTATVENLRQTKDLLIQNETLTAIGRMAEGVAHELRIPLTPVEGLLRRMLAREMPREQQVHFLDLVLKETERMRRLMDDMLALAQSDRLICGEESVIPLLHETLAQRQAEFERGGIRISLEAEPAVLTGDADKLKMAIGHLLDNAISALPTGGEIVVRCRPCACTAEGRRVEGVQISIRDSGEPIPDEALSQVFTPFFPCRNDARGFGLAIAYRVARAHGGTLLAHNPPEGGGEFSIYLPIRRPSAL